MDHPLIHYLRGFRKIPEEDQAILENAFEKKVFKEGDYLLYPGHISKELFFICTGVLRIVVLNEKGVEVTYFFLKEQQFCTILNSFNKEVIAEEGIQAATDAEVLAIKKHALLNVYKQLPYLKTLIDHIHQERLLEKIQIRNAYLGHDSAARYQLFLERQSEIASRVSMVDIASYLGITPQSLSRIRRNLR